ncbi:MAG: sulfotransferase domain-containing protein [Alphaproteobacteria bacterium]|nr:sulfotransferase domain-containing protein [Alphaproteobacteria bacterium]
MTTQTPTTDIGASHFSQTRHAPLLDPSNPTAYHLAANAAKSAKHWTVWANLRAFAALSQGLDRAELQALYESRFFGHSKYILFFLLALQSRKIRSARMEVALERTIVRSGRLSSDKCLASLTWMLRPIELEKTRLTIVTAAMPKSGSSYFCTILANLVDGVMISAHSANDRVGVAFDFLELLRALRHGEVIHSHLDASVRTRSALILFGKRPIVILRNVFDALVSYSEHSQDRHYAQSHHRGLAPNVALDIAIGRMASFYVDFFASWMQAAHDIPVKFIQYTDIITNPEATVRECMEWLGYSMSLELIANAVKKAEPSASSQSSRSSRFNVGRSGRGDERFTDDQKRYVRTFYLEYPQVDFSPIDPGFISQ